MNLVIKRVKLARQEPYYEVWDGEEFIIRLTPEVLEFMNLWNLDSKEQTKHGQDH